MKRNEIKVFHPHSKKADFSVIHHNPNVAAKKLGTILSEDAARKVHSAFRSLKALGAESMTLHADNRRIRVTMAQAA